MLLNIYIAYFPMTRVSGFSDSSEETSILKYNLRLFLLNDCTFLVTIP